MSLTVAIQGTKGSFHEIAAGIYFNSQTINLLYCQTFLDVFKALSSGKADKALVAIGNNRYGDIDHVYDILINSRLSKPANKYWISGEVYININHCLVGIEGTNLADIKEVHSQAPAIVQCFNFIHNSLQNPAIIEQDDTALSAQLVAQWQDKTKAAIASKQAASIYGLTILQDLIQDDQNNITRFLVIDPDEAKQCPGATKASMLLRTSHQPGALVAALKLFADNDINLSYLQSIPIPNKQFEYRFYVDIEAGLPEQRTKNSLLAIDSLGYQVDVLGSYARAEMPKLSM